MNTCSVNLITMKIFSLVIAALAMVAPTQGLAGDIEGLAFWGEIGETAHSLPFEKTNQERTETWYMFPESASKGKKLVRVQVTFRKSVKREDPEMAKDCDWTDFVVRAEQGSDVYSNELGVYPYGLLFIRGPRIEGKRIESFAGDMEQIGRDFNKAFTIKNVNFFLNSVCKKERCELIVKTKKMSQKLFEFTLEDGESQSYQLVFAGDLDEDGHLDLVFGAQPIPGEESADNPRFFMSTPKSDKTLVEEIQVRTLGLHRRSPGPS